MLCNDTRNQKHIHIHKHYAEIEDISTKTPQSKLHNEYRTQQENMHNSQRLRSMMYIGQNADIYH